MKVAIDVLEYIRTRYRRVNWVQNRIRGPDPNESSGTVGGQGVAIKLWDWTQTNGDVGKKNCPLVANS